MPWQDHLRVVTTGLLHGEVQQSWAGVYWLDRAIREFGVKSVVECGTGSGILTVFLALHVAPACCLTLDINDYRDNRTTALFFRLAVHFIHGNMHAPEVKVEAEANVARLPRPLLLLCDGGNKHQDFAGYTPLLRPGDVVAVHDAGTEFDAGRQDVQDICAARGLVRWHEDEITFDGPLLAIWKVGS